MIHLSYLSILCIALTGACTKAGPDLEDVVTPSALSPETIIQTKPQITLSPKLDAFATPTPKVTEIAKEADSFCASVVEIPLDECNALVAVYNHTDGNHWIMNNEDWVGKDDWLENNKPCSWAGIVCSDGHVIEISLPLNGLTGVLPSEIGALTRLIKLELTDNQLSSAPLEIGNLDNLIELNLGFNKLGSLPAEISELINLTGLMNYLRRPDRFIQNILNLPKSE